MREPATLSRRALAALPIAALAGTVPAAAVAMPAATTADAALLDLGRQWAAAWDAQVAHDRTCAAALDTMSDAEARDLEAVGGRLYEAEHALFDAIAAMPARTIAGLAVKAMALGS